MKKSMINSVHVEGLLYSHDLTEKVTGETSKNPGTSYITGSINVATDDACTNIVAVHFTYVVPTYSRSKSANPNYQILSDIVSGKVKNVLTDGKEKAQKLRIDSAIALNEFYSDRNGEEELVSAKRNEGGFIHLVSEIDADENKRNTFMTDMVITGVNILEADEERGLPEKAKVKGCIFDFRKSLLPVEFSATTKGAIDYFVGLNASNQNPIFTKVWGREIATTVVNERTEESAFGEAAVRTTTSSRRDFVITGAMKDPYEWDDESTLTAIELKNMMAERQTYLATLKQRSDEYKASQKATAPKSGGFDF